MIVCGRAARWWDKELKEKISLRRDVYKEVIKGWEDLWDEYCRSRREVKELVREKKLTIWNEVVEKVNVDFDGSRKEFWAFVCRRTEGEKKNRISLKSDAGVSVTSTRGKLEVLQKHYQHLAMISVDSDFDANWKEEVESKVSRYGSMSASCEDDRLDIAIEKGEIVKCIRIIKRGEVMA